MVVEDEALGHFKNWYKDSHKESFCATIILFSPKILKIYFYSTQAQYEDQIELLRTPMLKIGGTSLEEAEIRIVQQDTTSNPQELICKGIFETNFGDKEFHKYLLEKGYKKTRNDKDREWFHISVEEATHELEQYRGAKSVSKVAETRELYKHQEKFLTKIRSGWEQWKEFLLFAKCRSGKSTMVLSAIVKSGVKMTLVVSRFKSPEQSWREDCNLKNFENLVFIDVQKKNYKEEIEKYFPTKKQIIVWGTVQSKSKLMDLPCNVDLIVYDEAHEGYGSKQWNELSGFHNCKVLYVTGTAYNIEENFSNNNKFVYSYFEEQRDKKLGLNAAPSMELVLIKYNLNEKYKELYGDDPDAIKNTFSLNDDKTDFREPSLVRGFYSEHFGNKRHLKVGKRLLKNATHIYMCLASVESCHLSVKYLQGTGFAPLVVTGDTKEDSDSIKKHIAENPLGTIILTVRANVLGVTIEELDTVINCAEGDSKNFYFQFAFRGGSSKKNWTVIDFCPRRCLQTLREIYLSSCDNDPSISEYEFSDYFAAILEYSDGYTEMSPKRLAEILSSNDVENSRRIMSRVAYSMDFDKLKDFVMELDLTPSNQKTFKSEVISDADVNGKSNKKIVNCESKKRDFDVNLNKKIKTVETILERIPLVLFHMIRRNDSLNSIHSAINSKHYVYDTLDNENVLRSLLDEKIINERSLNCRMIQVATDIKHQIVEDECRTLEKLSCSRQSQKSIPVELMNQLLDDLF